MCETLVHRGPDDDGQFLDEASGIALGMRRLSIIDIEGGHQPMSNEDRTVRVIFNGEIYNHRELREVLEPRGHRFTSRSDTEVLVHLYEESGTQMLDALRGMFAFALWDQRRRRLFVARDGLGIKPLYYMSSGEGLAFASELRALRPVLPASPVVDQSAVAQYLALGYVPAPDSIYERVRKLPPGHYFTWSEEHGIELERYWSPVRAECPVRDYREAAARLRKFLTESVRYRLIADVPLGAFLSGGVDSSTIVALMSNEMDRPVKTFSIGFDDPRYNEAPHAARVARALGTEHTELIATPDVEGIFESVVARFDEPFADSSAIPTYLVSKLASEHVKVSLSGDGGDELFGGYTRYHDFLARDGHLPSSVRSLLGGIARRLPYSTYGRNRLLELSRSWKGRYAGLVAHPLRTSEGGVARPEVAALCEGMDELLAPWFDMVRERDVPTRLMLVDALTYLPGDILTKVDRMSMAVSLEARVPMLDREVAEFAFSLPSRLKFRNGERKWILREATRDLLPDAVFERPKRGFSVPLERWFRGKLRHRCDRLTVPDARIFEFADREAVHRVVAEHASERRDHSSMIWRLLVLEFWLEREDSAGGDTTATESRDR